MTVVTLREGEQRKRSGLKLNQTVHDCHELTFAHSPGWGAQDYLEGSAPKLSSKRVAATGGAERRPVCSP